MNAQFMNFLHPAWEWLIDFVVEHLSCIGFFAPFVAIPLVFAIFVGTIWLLRLVHKIEVLNVGTDSLLWPTIVAAIVYVVVGFFHLEGVWGIVVVAVFATAFLVAMVYSCCQIFRLDMGLFGKLLLVLDAAVFAALTFALSVAAILSSLALLMVLAVLCFFGSICGQKSRPRAPAASSPRQMRLDDGTDIEERGAHWYSKSDGRKFVENGDGTFTQTNL